jgi:hypothetical protein
VPVAAQAVLPAIGALAGLILGLVTLALVPGHLQAAATEAPPVERKHTIIRVGPGRALTHPSAAAKIARDGAVIEIDAGVYEGDAVVWRQNGLTIRGAGGYAHLKANGAHAEGKAIWVIKGANATIENVEFSGAQVADGNGAGIRQEGAGLTVRDCYFHHNENGILTGPNPASDIVIERSEFARNGYGDGYSHNLYIGSVRSFTLRASYVHRAVVGHNVKSRALHNLVAYNRIADYADGRSSYAIDLPNGGLAYVIGNVLQQGPATENDALVAYGAEGLLHPVNELYLVNNTLVNDLPAGGRFVFVRGEPGLVQIVNNVFSGAGIVLAGPGTEYNNALVARAQFRNAARFDYRLARGAAAVDRAVEPGAVHGFDLAPDAEYAHKARARPRPRVGQLDLGAFELRRQSGNLPQKRKSATDTHG